MRGITEERLRALFDDYQHKFLYSQLEKMYEPHAIMNILNMLVDECTELNAWQPIETATLRKTILLLNVNKTKRVFKVYSEDDRKFYTHWQELPEDPK